MSWKRITELEAKIKTLEDQIEHFVGAVACLEERLTKAVMFGHVEAIMPVCEHEWSIPFGLNEQSNRFCKKCRLNFKDYSIPVEKSLGREKRDGCGICNGEMVYIRGRIPRNDKRKICPTCAYEKLERIHEETAPGYGRACSSL